MSHEIERKYLLSNDDWKTLPLKTKYNIAQGYVNPQTTQLYINFLPNNRFNLTLIPTDLDSPKTALTLSASYNEASHFGDLESVVKIDQDSGEVSLTGNVICRFRLRENVSTQEKEAYLTIKAPTDRADVLHEFECLIDYDMALQMLDDYGQYNVYKQRSVIPHAGHVWEVDEFQRDLQGLIMAELEVEKLEMFDNMQPLPGLDRDVTPDKRYANRALGEFGIPKPPRPKINLL